MATYDYKCKKCELEKEISHSMKENPQIVCIACGENMGKMIPKTLNFVLKGASWSGKNSREKSFRSRRSREMGRKMARSHDIPQIQPNYNGEVCKNWEEASKLARDDGRDMARYSKQIENLKQQKKKVEEKRTKLLKGDA